MLATSQQAQMLLANFWQNACDKSETCGKILMEKALLHGSGRQGTYICFEHFIFKMSPQNGYHTSVHGNKIEEPCLHDDGI